MKCDVKVVTEIIKEYDLERNVWYVAWKLCTTTEVRTKKRVKRFKKIYFVSCDLE